MQTYMEQKYGRDYMSAISKLSIQNPFDEKGILKSELVLTDKEKEALLFYALDLEHREITLQQKQGKTYEDFLNDVRNHTIKAAENAMPSDSTDVTWDIVGVEFLGFKIKEEYGEDIYQRAHFEVPGTKIEGSRMFDRDFASANRQLGHLIHESVSASPLMDLQLFMEALDINGVPSYIDYENNVFHYNAQRKILKNNKFTSF